MLAFCLTQSRQPRLTRTDQEDNEQPGCIHAGMDLYKYAYEMLPLISSETVADCFDAARTAREVDMRASPYALSSWGLRPIRVETTSGRNEYATQQRILADVSSRLRRRLTDELESIRDWVALNRAENQGC